MKEKDLAEKQLEVYEDVYADIVNVLLFQGDKELWEKELETADNQSVYIGASKLHGQERDVTKYWKNEAIRLAFIGVENQTTIDKSMPMRILGYDGAAYRAQLLDKKQKAYYPVITLVLYFGYEKHWRRPLGLKECLQIPQKLQPYVNDYRMNLFEIAYLPEEQVALFQSDFRIIADYFVQMHKTRCYVPNKIPMVHTYETMQLLSMLTKDKRFAEVCKMEQEGGMTMCEVLDRIEAKGFRRGEKLGRFAVLKELVEEGILTVGEAARRVHMSEENFRKKCVK